MASNSNRPNLTSSSSSQQVLNNQTNSTIGVKEKTNHNKSADGKIKHDKSSASASGHMPMSSNSITNSNNSATTRKKPTSSFQITSVSVNTAGANAQQQQQQRNSTDNNGDDSADDLDESHTDDSRITDYETPSISEDTFSREDVFFTQSSAFGTAPVIPTSSQYGLAIVGPSDMGANGQNLSDVHVSVTDAGINIMGQLPNKQDVDIHHKNERFKVVKIESTEPFKRGRWMCMDYLDHTTLQAQDDGIDGNVVVATKDSGIIEMISEEQKLSINEAGEIVISPINENNEQDQEMMEVCNSHNEPNSANTTVHHHASHAQTMASIPFHHENSPSIASPILNHAAQSMPQGQIEQILSQAYASPQNQSENINNIPGSNQQTQNPSSESLPPLQMSGDGQPAPAPSIGQSQSTTSSHHIHNHNQHAQSMTPEMIQHSFLKQQQEHQHLQQGATLPANILMQNLGLHQQNQQSQPQLNSPNASQYVLPPPSSQTNATPTTPSLNVTNTENPSSGDNTNKNDNVNVDLSNPLTSQSQQIGTGDMTQQLNESDQQSGNLTTNDNSNNTSSNNNINNNNNNGTQNISSPSSSAGPGIGTDGGATGGASESNESALNINNGNGATGAIGDDGQSLEDSESASGTSAVAIDNKIEQAMDLVKSHLMFAVREEVEVLKEKIAELMDRINQLEVENTILRANASQETLSQLSATLVVPPVSSPAQPVQQQPNPSPMAPQTTAPLPAQSQIASSLQQQQQQSVPATTQNASQNTQNASAAS